MTVSNNINGAATHMSGKRAVEKDAFNMLLELGIPPRLKGFGYIIDAVCILYEHPEWEHNVVDVLYRDVAERNGTTAACVERCIRSSICKIKQTVTKNKRRYSAIIGAEITPKKLICAITEYFRDADTDISARKQT